MLQTQPRGGQRSFFGEEILARMIPADRPRVASCWTGWWSRRRPSA